MGGSRKKKVELDERYLGQKLPGNEEQRESLPEDLVEILEDHGPEWVWENRVRLLAEARMCVREGVV